MQLKVGSFFCAFLLAIARTGGSLSYLFIYIHCIYLCIYIHIHTKNQTTQMYDHFE